MAGLKRKADTDLQTGRPPPAWNAPGLDDGFSEYSFPISSIEEHGQFLIPQSGDGIHAPLPASFDYQPAYMFRPVASVANGFAPATFAPALPSSFAILNPPSYSLAQQQQQLHLQMQMQHQQLQMQHLHRPQFHQADAFEGTRVNPILAHEELSEKSDAGSSDASTSRRLSSSERTTRGSVTSNDSRIRSQESSSSSSSIIPSAIEDRKVYDGSLSPEALLGIAPLTESLPPPVTVPPALKNAVTQYLNDTQEENSLIILNSKVAQKSYGTEKRFFCPPPAVILTGENWRRSEKSTGDISLFISIEENGKDAQQYPIDGEGKAIFKNLFISDSDKRKNFSLSLRIVKHDGREFGTFKSKPIKVISKPSKKKQSAKNIELCITSGTAVSLFNRVRSQTVSTKYLAVENNAFVAKNTCWDAFTITAYGRKPPTHGEELYLHYGMEVVLQSILTGVTSSVLILRKADKSQSMVVADEPVSQLHKVAFLVKGSDHQYLALVQESITMEKAMTSSDPNNEGITESAAWTIVGTERVQYSFYEGSGPSTKGVTPVPTVDHIKVQSKALVEIYGENFSPSLMVWFGHTPSRTRYRCEEFIVCEPPPFALVAENENVETNSELEVPLLLVRHDGVIYATGKKYLYTVEPVPMQRAPASTA